MRAYLIGIVGVGFQDPTQMHLAQDNDVVRTFTPDRADQPFGKTVLLGRGRCGRFPSHGKTRCRRPSYGSSAPRRRRPIRRTCIDAGYQSDVFRPASRTGSDLTTPARASLRYGPSDRSAAQGRLCRRAPTQPANNLQQSWRFDWEPPKAVLRDVRTIDWILGC
jgi:hypothetical protein